MCSLIERPYYVKSRQLMRARRKAEGRQANCEESQQLAKEILEREQEWLALVRQLLDHHKHCKTFAENSSSTH